MSHTPELALTVHDVSVTYSNGHQAIRNASFSLGGGTICALVGVNGSGKSTLFKSIMGLVKPSSGHVRLNGEAISEALKKISSLMCRKRKRLTGIFPCWFPT